MKTRKILVTGAAGFIGMHTAKRLLEQGVQVVGLDNLNDYYDPALKHHRLEQLTPYNNFRFIKMDLADREGMAQLFKTEQLTQVIHLAAQAGVRYSLENPFAYVDSNLVGTMCILEGCRHNQVQHLLYASSSSVYGMNAKIPFSETDQVDEPVSLYAATKKSNELMAYSYAKLYGIPTTGLRFFTVYGPAGRPDMAPWLFTEAILKGEPIKVFNHGKMQRDFTYIDDIVEGIVRILELPPGVTPSSCAPHTPSSCAQSQDPAPSAPQQPDLAIQHPAPPTNKDNPQVPHQLFNIGNNQPIQLSRFIQAIETACGKQAEKIMLPMQPGDVERTYADTSRLETAVGYKPQMEIEEGIARFVEWYKGRSQKLSATPD